MVDGESRRRRDVLRTGAMAGLVAFGWPVGDALAGDQNATQGGQTTTQGGQTTTQDGQTTTQDGQSQYAFSYGLQQGDLFRVQSQLRTPEGDPVTETIPSTCLDAGPREFSAFVVRAYRSNIELGYEGLFVPPQVAETTATTETTATETGATETTATADAEETTQTATMTAATETTETTATETARPANETTRQTVTTTTEAAAQDETTTTAAEQTTTIPETTTIAETTAAETETTPGGETPSPETERTTTGGGGTLPEIRVGAWYRVASMSKCDSLARLVLEPAEPRESRARN